MIIPVDSLSRPVVDSLMMNLKVGYLEELLKHQSTTYTVLIMVFIAAFTFLSGFAIWKFVRIPKEAVDQVKAEMIRAMEDTLNQKWLDFKEKLSKNQSAEFSKLDNNILAVKTQFFRITGIGLEDRAETDVDLLDVLLYYRNALKGYISLDKGKFITMMMNGILDVLEKVKNPMEVKRAFEELDFQADFNDHVLSVTNSAPDTLRDQKRRIKQILDKWKIDSGTN